MNQTQNLLLADLIIDGKKSKESGLYISEMAFDEGISQVSKAVLTVCSNSLCLKLRGKKDLNGEQTKKGLLDYLDQKATICFLDNEKISRTFTGKITSVTHLGVSNTVSSNIYKYEFIVEPTIADMKQSHHTRQIKKTINDAIKEILSTYYGDATIDFVETESDKNIYLFYQQNETDYDFFLRLLTQFGLSFFVNSQKNEDSDEYFERVIISDGKSFELPTATRPANSHTDRNLNILVNKSSKTKSKNIRISSWQMSNSTTIDEICKTDSLKKKDNDKRLWFLDSLATPHSETQTDEKTRDKVACNYLNSIRSSSANWFGTAHLNDFQATDILNIFDFYSPCNLDSEEKEKSALLSEDTIRARIVSLNLLLTNVLPFAIDSSALSPVAEVKFRCAEISKEAPSTFTTFANKDALSPKISVSDSQAAFKDNKDLNIFSDSKGGADIGLSIKKATVCYPSTTTEEDLAKLPKRNAQAKINIDANTGECFFYAKIDNSTKPNEVLFTMPIAGLGQGLYRYPRIGERILVLDNKDSRYILLSYLPDTKTMPFFQSKKASSDEEIKTLLKLNGLTEEQQKEIIKKYQAQESSLADGQLAEQSVATVLRHSSNNFMINKETEADITNYLSEESSKKFTASLKPLNRNVDASFKATDYQNKDIKYSEIGMYSGSSYYDDEEKQWMWSPETLRIQTPGNQYNHTGLTNVSTANAFVFSTPNATKFGEFRVIDVGSVVIDAKRSITLKVAGNVIKISETGISIGSQSTCTEGTPYDSKLSLNPIGASLSGLEVKIGSTMSTSVSSGFGELIKLNKGKVGISGHSVDLATDDNRSMNFDLACYYIDLAQYLALFALDQANMKKRLDIGYNDMVKTGAFDFKFKLASKDAKALEWFEKVYGTVNKPVWGLAQKFVRLGYKLSAIPPSIKYTAAFILETITDFLFLTYDSVIILLTVDILDLGVLKKLTPEQTQRQTTIVNFIKIVTKTVFLSLAIPAIKKHKVGDCSYQKMSPSAITTFSPELSADFVNFKATAHNFPLNPLTSAPTTALEGIPGGLAKATATLAAQAMQRVTGIGTAAAFAALLEASAEAPAFTIKSEKGSVSLDSCALKALKTEIKTALAKFDVTSSQSKVNVKSASNKFTTTGKLDVSADMGFKLTSKGNSISINPVRIETTCSSLDMKTKQLQMKASVALKVDGAAFNLDSNAVTFKGQSFNLDSKVLKVNSPTITVGGQLVKVG